MKETNSPKSQDESNRNFRKFHHHNAVLPAGNTAFAPAFSLIRKHALKNALDFGRANANAVMGKVLAEMPEFKDKIVDIIPLIDDAVHEVNRLSKDQIKEEVSKYEFKPKKEKKRDLLPDFKNQENVRMRFAPNPSGPLHLGHTRAAILNDEYVKRYNGTLILRLEDTDPSRVDPQAYDMIKKDLEWLGVNCHETIFQSDRLDLYYEHARTLIKDGHVYVCTCTQEEFKRLRDSKKPCKCRANAPETNMAGFEKMFTDYHEGQAVLRLKTDLDLPDQSMRDYPIMRISEHPHPRIKGKKVYPLMNFSVTIDDHLTGLTHVLRGKDHIVNTRKQEFLYRYFGWKVPEYIHYGRMKIEGLALSTSGIKKGIETGEYTGWDDVRLGTLQAMAKRGIKPGAIRKAMLDVGIKESDINFSWKNLYANNRAIIEKDANRYFFVENPKVMQIEGCIGVDTTPPLHPEYPEKGTRKITLKPERGSVFISDTDFEKLNPGSFVRLMEAFNVEIIQKNADTITAKFHSKDLSEARKRKANLIHWVETDEIRVKVISPGGIIEGVGETDLKNVTAGQTIQFERFGFVRIHKADNRQVVVYFTHK